MNRILTASNHIYRDLRTRILNGDLPAGYRLVQRQLAGEYDTSSIPVIESIRMLERDGLVVNTAGLGAQVREWSDSDIMALYLLRQAFEGTVCRLFSQNATSVDQIILKDLRRKYDDFAKDGDANGCIESDIELHLHLAKCSGSPFLYHFTENSCVITDSLKNGILPTAGVVGSHDELISAVNSGNPDVAELAGRKHIGFVIEELEAAFAYKNMVGGHE